MFREIAWRDGANFVHGYLDKLIERNELFLAWSPKLRKFAEQCRRDRPLPVEADLPLRDRAKLPIYKIKIKAAGKSPDRKEKTVDICCLPLIAIPTAKRMWPTDDDRCVYLTPEELAQWQTVYSHPESAFWWFVDFWWSIEDPPKSGGLWNHDNDLALPGGGEPWLVTWGHSWGSLAGGETAELWAWNGAEAAFVKQIGCCDF
jgi:hypothetical protein